MGSRGKQGLFEPSVSPLTLPETHTHTHPQSPLAPPGVITVAITIHASLGCSHADFQFRKCSSSHTHLSSGWSLFVLAPCIKDRNCQAGNVVFLLTLKGEGRGAHALNYLSRLNRLCRIFFIIYNLKEVPFITPNTCLLVSGVYSLSAFTHIGEEEHTVVAI